MIIGKRITLRAWEAKDLEPFTRWFNDPEVTIYLGQAYPALSREQEARYMNDEMNRPNRYSIVLNEDGLLIGNCDLHAIDTTGRSAEVGIVLGEKAYWNQGYGREALGMLLEIGFEGLGLNRIGLRVYDINPRGLCCYLAAGFVEEGRLRQTRFIKGKFRDEIVMSVLAEEYWARKEASGED
ncbi:MAG: GNAT family N-acetyltransferase [Chloroflexi bacterium]|nr:GNAT family N-acetyltransferase [Chloroflexota bacterium]